MPGPGPYIPGDALPGGQPGAGEEGGTGDSIKDFGAILRCQSCGCIYIESPLYHCPSCDRK